MIKVEETKVAFDFTTMEDPPAKRLRLATNISDGSSTTNLCMKMAYHLMLKETEEGSTNFVFSPFSFHLMLSFVTVGFTGRTLSQLLLALGAPTVEDLNAVSARAVPLASPADPTDAGAPLLSFVNGAWVDQRYPFKPSFETTAKDVYKAVAQQVDFQTQFEKVRNEINSWTENQTKGLIKNLLPPGSLDDKTVVVLANALYFKGAWAKTFDASRTKDKSFHLLDGRSVEAPFMTTPPFEYHLYGSFPRKGYKVLKVPYKTGLDTRKFSMYFFLPNAIDGLPLLINEFKSDPTSLNKEFQLRHELIEDFWIPKFKFSYDFEASKIVDRLGLDLPLKQMEELTEMIEYPCDPPELSKMFHKACIEVNEEGTEAAASTAAICIMQCAVMDPPRFVADHPFMFMIREDTSGFVFFIGAVLNPLSSD